MNPLNARGEIPEISISTLDHLNKAQLEAVTAPPSNLLVLAGAGSGKTRVLVHRIAWLIEHYQVSPGSILAVTFTNKAAGEMRERAQKLLPVDVRAMWIGTFHGLANRLLRIHHTEADLPENFEILDTSNQLRVVKQALEARKLDTSKQAVQEAANSINRWKESGKRVNHVSEFERKKYESHFSAYSVYEKLCQSNAFVDFGELLLRSYELLLNNKEVTTLYRERFQHILVDEFQDTNPIQYAWMAALAGKTSHLMAVGDDDQSIYGWRGARIGHLKDFTKQFAEVRTIRLEQNYRSTRTILGVANSVIKHNPSRIGKTLWTKDEAGERVRVYNAFDEMDEAAFVASLCKDWMSSKSFNPEDFAILYRNNSQSRLLEHTLTQLDLPFVVRGGTRFYDRTEIRHALAYMRLIQNPRFNAAFERVVNIPARGIGSRTLETIKELAQERDLSLWESTLYALKNKLFNNRASTALHSFKNLVDALKKSSINQDLEMVARVAIRESGLYSMYSKQKGELDYARTENLDELTVACRQFELEDRERMNPNSHEESSDIKARILQNFLDHTTLDVGEKPSAGNDAISLMTLHSAKGLEFPVVFMVGLEEGLFPHWTAATDPEREQEERRLAYVGITRAMKLLVMTYASSRALFSNPRKQQRFSRYLAEIPTDYLSAFQKSRNPSTGQWFLQERSAVELFDTTGMEETPTSRAPQTIYHSKLGMGRIVGSRGEGSSRQLEIQFGSGAGKWFIANSKFLSRVDS